MIFKLNLPPGIYRNGTAYQSMGRFYDSNLVRWHEGVLRPVGGWVPVEYNSGGATPLDVGEPVRGAIAWRGDDGASWLAFGTPNKLWAYADGELTDITPSDLVPGTPNTVANSGGYGSGIYGAGSYGEEGISITYTPAAVWTLDTFGDYLVGVLPSDGRVLVWPRDTGVDASEADPDAPEDCRAVVVTPERFLVALGAGGNLRRVQWASQETYQTWLIDGTNSAGYFDLETEGALVAGLRARSETLLWTDADLHAMRYIGGVFLYGFEKLGDKCGLIAPNAKVMFEGGAAWMSRNGFYVYDGFVRQIPCDVFDYVYGSLNTTQRNKIWAVTQARFSEVWWFYPSATSTEVDRYVVWNWKTGNWYIGQLDRTAGVDLGSLRDAVMFTSGGEGYWHEVGYDHDGATVFAESGPLEIADGDRTFMVQQLIPDERTSGQVQGMLYTRFYPNGAEQSYGPYAMSEKVDIRVTARQARFRIYEFADANDWRWGVPRFRAEQAGER